jgi:hypothetical protein
MSDPQFRQRQKDGVRAPQVAPINALVDELNDPSGRGWVPYVSPDYGGVDARVLTISRDPGPKTHRQHDGSGFLSAENDDPGAERFASLLDGVGIPVGETLSWNAYPWYIYDDRRKPSAADLEAGVEPLRRLLGLLPRLRVVMLFGREAQNGWKRLARRHPDLVTRFEVVPTFSTANRAFIGTPEVRAERMANLKEAFERTARILQEPDRGPLAHS